MKKAVFHTPKTKVHPPIHRSFNDTLASGIGTGYIIDKSGQLSPGDYVVLLDKPDKRRAEGILRGLVPAGKAKNGKPRYNVQIAKLSIVPYKPESLDRNGVAVI